MSVEERLATITERLTQLLKEYRTAEDPPIFALRDEALRLLRPLNLIKTLKMSSRFVVVHPQNRYGDGIIPSHCHYLVDSFATKGFSWAEIGIPLASEVPPPNNPRYKLIVQFNSEIVTNSCGALPPIAEEEYILMSAAKSHSSMGSRCVIFEIPHDNEKITDCGKLSLHKIRAIRPEYAEAISSGFEWTVVCWQVEEAFPSLMDLLQEAGNSAQAASLDETRWQVALKMYASTQRLLQTKDMTTETIAEAVEREALRGAPAFASEIHDLHTYVRNMAGEDSWMLKELIAFSKTLKVPRIVNGPVLAAVSEVSLGEDGHGATFFRQDLIKAMMSASDKYSNGDGTQNLAEVSTIKTQGQKKTL